MSFESIPVHALVHDTAWAVAGGPGLDRAQAPRQETTVSGGSTA